MSQDMKDRVAVVTGGGSGIGRAVVAAVAAEGAVVIAGDVNLDAAQGSIDSVPLGAAGSRGVFLDVTDTASIADCLATASANGSAHEIVVNCAGVSLEEAGDGPLHEVPPEIDREIPLRRFAEPSEIRSAALYLASPHSSYTTGVILSVDGGRVAH